jgi:hypothetical protein
MPEPSAKIAHPRRGDYVDKRFFALVRLFDVGPDFNAEAELIPSGGGRPVRGTLVAQAPKGWRRFRFIVRDVGEYILQVYDEAENILGQTGRFTVKEPSYGLGITCPSDNTTLCNSMLCAQGSRAPTASVTAHLVVPGTPPEERAGSVMYVFEDDWWATFDPVDPSELGGGFEIVVRSDSTERRAANLTIADC